VSIGWASVPGIGGVILAGVMLRKLTPLLATAPARGWTPTPTGTVDGPVVLGHAACRLR
jgi:hypothetical protein